MTPLLSPITRTMDLGRGPVAITLDPAGGGMITFRHKGARHSYSLPLAAVYAQAVGRAVAQTKAEKRQRRSEFYHD